MKKKESVGVALERACRWHVAKALENLAKSDVPDAIHDVRKEIKKLRALWRLAREVLGKKEYRKASKVMRLAAKPLAPSRDARVTCKAFEAVAGAHASEFPGIQASLRIYSRHAERAFKDFDTSAVAKLILKEVGKELDGVNFKGMGWAELRRALKKSFSRGREAFDLAHRQPAEKNLHRWRKRVKDLGYQLDFLCPEWPASTKAVLASLDKLGEELGDNHDLTLVEGFVGGQPEYAAEATRLKKLIGARHRSDLAAIRKLGAALFASTPEDFCKRVEKDWKAWRCR